MNHYNENHNNHIEFMFDFIDMIYLPVFLDFTVDQVDVLFIDEAQDLSAIQQEFLKKMLKPGGRRVIMGDEKQCQPPETLIRMADGSDKRIDELEIGDGVLTYERQSTYILKNGIVDDIKIRDYSGQLYKIESGCKTSKCTPNHKWVARWTDRKSEAWITYLMKKGTKYRIGQCQLFKHNKGAGMDFGLGIRARIERADCAWILKIHNSLSESLIYEKILSSKYGIPEVIFYPSWNIKYFTQEVIEEIYNSIGDLTLNAIECLSDHNRDIDYPFYKRKENQQRQGKTTIFETQACNLIPEYMSLPISPDIINYKNKSVIWHKIEKITIENYNGNVYSLDIKKHHKYISDGIATCNSIYGFSGSDINSWNKFKEIPGIVELPLSYCYRCGKNIVDKANLVHNIMESPSWMDDGEVVENGNLLYVNGGDFVICRNTKPLVELYFEFLNLEKPCYIKGSDIGRGLNKVIEPYKTLQSLDAITEMEKELNKIYKGLLQHGVAQPQRNQKYIAYQEKIEIIKLFSLKYKYTQAIIDAINRIFRDDDKEKKNLIVLSTIHKAKGLESNTVYLYLPHLIPSKYAEKDWELDQEANLLYVAITRAKKKLVFVKEKF